ncbi:phage tail protein [Enterobacter kobei]|uniref:phage tail fiber protein n=1 Tax=Enterobacter kobei TaxID=208224 RepID=UPI003D6EB451
MLYNTGTIAINGNTATGTGTNWTAPASQVRAGQTIIVMSNPVQMFQISSVNSATSMTVTPSASPALSGQKYGILVSDNISVDGLAQAMSQLIKEYDENIGAWETFATTSANQSITVTINGASVNIPAIGVLARKGVNSDITELKGLTTALSIAQGGTGATTAEGVRQNLGLGSSATRNAYSSSGDILSVGDFGLGSTLPRAPYADTITNMFYTPGDAGVSQPTSDSGWCHLVLAASNYYRAQLSLKYSEGKPRAFILNRYGTSSGGWSEIYSTANTTKTSDGTLKAASPVVKVFSDGTYQTNNESEGVKVTRLGVGQYLIEGCEALNSDAAWGGIDGGFDIPTDRNKQPLIWLDYEVYADGSVLVRTYHRTHPDAPAFARNELQGINDGDPVDIPGDQFVSVRVEMPADSLYNQRIRAAELAMTADQGE